MNLPLLLADQRKQNDVKAFMPSETMLEKLANYFSSYCDPTRLKIISCLSIGEFCVNDLSLLLNTNQTTISHQLKTLKSEGMVSFSRHGKLIVYSLSSRVANETLLLAVNYLSSAGA